MWSRKIYLIWSISLYPFQLYNNKPPPGREASVRRHAVRGRAALRAPLPPGVLPPGRVEELVKVQHEELAPARLAKVPRARAQLRTRVREATQPARATPAAGRRAGAAPEYALHMAVHGAADQEAHAGAWQNAHPQDQHVAAYPARPGDRSTAGRTLSGGRHITFESARSNGVMKWAFPLTLRTSATRSMASHSTHMYAWFMSASTLEGITSSG